MSYVSLKGQGSRNIIYERENPSFEGFLLTFFLKRFHEIILGIELESFSILSCRSNKLSNAVQS